MRDFITNEIDDRVKNFKKFEEEQRNDFLQVYVRVLLADENKPESPVKTDYEEIIN